MTSKNKRSPSAAVTYPFLALDLLGSTPCSLPIRLGAEEQKALAWKLTRRQRKVLPQMHVCEACRLIVEGSLCLSPSMSLTLSPIPAGNAENGTPSCGSIRTPYKAVPDQTATGASLLSAIS